MKTYTIRHNGTMIASVSGRPANKILQSLEGFWREYKSKNAEPTRCFEITEDTKYGIEHNGDGLAVYLWEGTLIIED